MRTRELRILVLARPAFTAAHESFLRARELEWLPEGDATPAEQLIEFAGRVCYLSFVPNRRRPRPTREFVRDLIRMGHESVLEHASWSLLIEGIPRSLSHQIVRHRAGFSFSQLSQQYHDESEAEFVRPPGLSNDPTLERCWQEGMAASRQLYGVVLSRLQTSPALGEKPSRERLRAARSIARSVLPNATATVLVATANARAWRTFLRLRGPVEGDLEMRLLSCRLLEVLEPEAPAVFADLRAVEHADGFPIIELTAG